MDIFLINYTPGHWILHAHRSSFNHQQTTKLYRTINKLFNEKVSLPNSSLLHWNRWRTKIQIFQLVSYVQRAKWMVTRFVPTRIVFNFESFRSETAEFIVSLIYCWDECWQSFYVKICKQVCRQVQTKFSYRLTMVYFLAMNQCQSIYIYPENKLNVHKYHVACVFNTKSQNETWNIHKKLHRLETWPNKIIRCHFVG